MIDDLRIPENFEKLTYRQIQGMLQRWWNYAKENKYRNKFLRIAIQFGVESSPHKDNEVYGPNYIYEKDNIWIKVGPKWLQNGAIDEETNSPYVSIYVNDKLAYSNDKKIFIPGEWSDSLLLVYKKLQEQDNLNQNLHEEKTTTDLIERLKKIKEWNKKS